MNYEQIKLLVAIARSGTISDVAEKNNISHSAVSRQITNMENALGITLFNRSRKGSTLTEEGAKAVVIAQQILELYDQLQELRRDATLFKEIKIGSSTIESLQFIPPIIRRFKESFPAVNLHFYNLPVPDIKAHLKDCDLDMGLSFFTDSELAKTKESFLCKKLLSTHLVVLVNPESPLSRRAFVEPEDLRGQQFVLQRDSTVLSAVKKIMGENEFTIFSHMDQESMIKDCVTGAHAITFSTECFIQRHPLVLSKDICYLPVKSQGTYIDMHYCYYYLLQKQPNLIVAECLKILRDELKRQYGR